MIHDAIADLQEYSTCVAQTHRLVNWNAKDSNGDYVCRTQECYSLDEVSKAIYVYNSLVKREIITNYDDTQENNDKINAYVSQTTGIAQGRVAAIMYWLWKGVHSGEITTSLCLKPLTNKTSVILWIASAVALCGVGSYLIFKQKKLFKHKPKGKKNA